MNRVSIRPELLTWARERAGFSIEALARRFPKLEEWEDGNGHPTLKQLEAFAKATFTPVGFMFLEAAPEEHVPIPDFRTIASKRSTRPSPDLLDTVYLCQQRQEWYRDFARSNGQTSLAFVGSVKVSEDISSVAAHIRDALGLDMNARRRMSTWTDALRHFIEQADALGILVMCSGVVGSNSHRHLDPQEFRGFAIADAIAPLVFINGADTKAAQMFTLAHELAHVWLGQSAVSDARASGELSNEIGLLAISDAPASRETSHKVERWCNAVAAELLVPIKLLRAEYNASAALDAEMNRLARYFKVSTLVTLRRIYDAGGLTREAFWTAYDAELARLEAIPKGSGGNFYLTLGARASKRFARALVVSTLEGRTSFTESFRLLGIKKLATFHDLGRTLGVGF